MSQSAMIRRALLSRPAPKGKLIHVPKDEGYLYCPETDWLYSTKLSSIELYPMSRVLPTTWNDQFEGFNVTIDGEKKSLRIDYLRSLTHKGNVKMWPTKDDVKQPNNAPTTNAADFKGKFLIGSIDKTTGAVSFSAFPARQGSEEAAKKEAGRLAGLHKNKMFMVVGVEAIASVQDVVWL